MEGGRSVTASAVVPEAALTEAMAAVRATRRQGTTAPSLDDPFLAGLPYREYFALSDDEAEALWEALAAEAPACEDLPVSEARPDARLPPGQTRRPEDHGRQRPGATG